MCIVVQYRAANGEAAFAVNGLMLVKLGTGKLNK